MIDATSTVSVVPILSIALSSFASPLSSWLQPSSYTPNEINQQQVFIGGEERNEDVGLSSDERWPAGWADPSFGGGRMLDYATKTMGEPMNVIISGLSDPAVLHEEGFKDYSKSIGFSPECLGLHAGGYHSADLGDGNGRQDQHYLARQAYFDTIYGPCWESLIGGNHFRAWKQNGTDANTEAWFLAVSKELFLGKRHTIAADGYNKGRDWLVERAVQGGSWQDKSWIAEIEWVESLLEPGSDGVNHGIAQDGRVAILTVSRVFKKV